eukprot:3926161-Rhodomonas_salina.7
MAEDCGDEEMLVVLEDCDDQEMPVRSSLYELFLSYSGGSLLMGGMGFSKLAKECDVVSSRCGSGDIDLIFAGVKDGPSFRKITFDEFRKAILLCAGRREQACSELEELMLATWTSKLELQERNPKERSIPSRPTAVRERLRADAFKKFTSPTPLVWTASESEKMAIAFDHFCAGELEMGQKLFAKFAKECNLMTGNRGCTRGDIDLIFTKVLSKLQTHKPSRRIGYQQWLAAISCIAEKRGEDVGKTESKILAKLGYLFPQSSADSSKMTSAKPEARAQTLQPSSPASATS